MSVCVCVCVCVCDKLTQNIMFHKLLQNLENKYIKRHHDTQYNNFKHNDTKQNGLICDTQYANMLSVVFFVMLNAMNTMNNLC